MTIGLKTVREICVRCPLVMNPELLQVRCTAAVQCCPALLSCLRFGRGEPLPGSSLSASCTLEFTIVTDVCV
jgi:hypothetical protein